jgi:hypothetical protein
VGFSKEFSRWLKVWFVEQELESVRDRSAGRMATWRRRIDTKKGRH